jgi:hypothetical protein
MSTCCSKHVEAWNKYIEKECVKLVINQNYVEMHDQQNIKFCIAKQANQIYKYKNIKIKLFKNNAAIWYNKICRMKQLTPGVSSWPARQTVTHQSVLYHLIYWYKLALLMMSACCSKRVEALNKYIEKECVKLVINRNCFEMLLHGQQNIRNLFVDVNEFCRKRNSCFCIATDDNTQCYIKLNCAV